MSMEHETIPILVRRKKCPKCQYGMMTIQSDLAVRPIRQWVCWMCRHREPLYSREEEA